jgi:hypothetical protein
MSDDPNPANCSAITLLARTIYDMKYRDLQELARQFCEVIRDRDLAFDLDQPTQWAEMLAEWAESEMRDAQERAIKADLINAAPRVDSTEASND